MHSSVSIIHLSSPKSWISFPKPFGRGFLPVRMSSSLDPLRFENCRIPVRNKVGHSVSIQLPSGLLFALFCFARLCHKNASLGRGLAWRDFAGRGVKQSGANPNQGRFCLLLVEFSVARQHPAQQISLLNPT